MGIQEKEIIELFRKMKAEKGGTKITSDGLATLTAARVIKRVMEKCCIEVCGAIEQSQPEYELKLTLHQANAVIDMDNHGYSESLGPEDEGTCEGWGELLSLAETVTGRTANANLSDDRTPREIAQEAAAETRKAKYHQDQAGGRQDFGQMAPPYGGDMTPPGGGRMV